MTTESQAAHRARPRPTCRRSGPAPASSAAPGRGPRAGRRARGRAGLGAVRRSRPAARTARRRRAGRAPTAHVAGGALGAESTDQFGRCPTQPIRRPPHTGFDSEPMVTTRRIERGGVPRVRSTCRGGADRRETEIDERLVDDHGGRGAAGNPQERRDAAARRCSRRSGCDSRESGRPAGATSDAAPPASRRDPSRRSRASATGTTRAPLVRIASSAPG